MTIYLLTNERAVIGLNMHINGTNDMLQTILNLNIKWFGGM